VRRGGRRWGLGGWRCGSWFDGSLFHIPMTLSECRALGSGVLDGSVGNVCRVGMAL